MADSRIRRALIRVISDENLDLYLLGPAALAFTVLGITGITSQQTTSAVVVAFLALLAFSQLRSRKMIEQIRDSAQAGANSLFMREFPADLIARRAQARDILLIGHSLTRTVQGLRSEMAAILATGARIRVLVLDVTDEPLIAVADRRTTHTLGPEKLLARIKNTLDDLTSLRNSTGGRLEIRVSSAISAVGINCLDTDSPRGLVCVQHFEYHPSREAAPIFTLEPSDGGWYQHFVDEAERLWSAGTEWPLSATAATRRASRPVFSQRFGPELDTAIDETSDMFVTGMARNTFVMDDFGRLERKLRVGNRLRFMLNDPDSAAVDVAAERYYAERSPDSARERIRKTLRLLAELKATTHGNLTVRLTSHPFAVGAIYTESGLFLEYYSYQAPGEPKFVLQAGDAGYDSFLGEAEKLWESARNYEV